MFHRNGLLYVAGYNSSFGVTESGNMYAARFNVYELAGVIQSTNDLQLLVPIEEDCTMPRVLYVENMFGDTSQVNILGYQVCKWCGSNDFTINESELEDTAIYKGIIGNTLRENRLLEFSQLHGFNQLYFYNSAYLFWNTGEQINNQYTVNLTLGGSKNLVVYLKERLYKFITEAYKNRYIDYVGLSGARFWDSNDNYTIYFNAQNYNSFANTFNYYNYSFAGKLKQIVLEDEFWKIDEENPPVGPAPHPAYYAQRYQDHKDYLKRMLTLSRNDMNFRKVDDYIARTYNTDEIFHANRDSIELVRSKDLELITDSVYNKKYIDRFFIVYDLNTRWPYEEDVNRCADPNTNFAIWGRETPYIPWHRDDYSYRTMIFGHRPNNKATQVYPIFYGMAACLDDRLTKKPTVKDDNNLGFWLGVVDPNNTTEQRTLAKAEEQFIGTFSQNTHYNHVDKGANLKINGFTYFTYELFEIVNQLNIANNHTYNFSDNYSTPRIQQNDTFSNNSCWYNIPETGPGYFGEIGPGKVGKKNGKQSIDIAAFPNPANNSISYQIDKNGKSGSKSPIYRIELIDVMGRRHFYVETESLSGSIATEQLKSGLYYLRVVESYSNISSNKIIIISK